MFLISRLFRVTVTSRKTEDLVVWLVLSLPATGLQMQVTLQIPWETLSIPLSAEEKAAGCINTNPSSVKHSHRNLTVTWEFLSWVCHVGPIQAALCSFVEPTREQWALQENNLSDTRAWWEVFQEQFSTKIFNNDRRKTAKYCVQRNEEWLKNSPDDKGLLQFLTSMYN